MVPADARRCCRRTAWRWTSPRWPVSRCRWTSAWTLCPAPPHPRASTLHRSFKGATVVAGRAARRRRRHRRPHRALRAAVALAARTPSASGVQARPPGADPQGAAAHPGGRGRGDRGRRAAGRGADPAGRRRWRVGGGGCRERAPLVAHVRPQLAAARRLSRRGVLRCAPRAPWRHSVGWTPSASTDGHPSPRTSCGCAGSRAPTARSAGWARRRTADAVLGRRARCPGRTATAPAPPTPPTRPFLDAAGDDPDWRQEEGLPFETSPAATPPPSDARAGEAPPCWWSGAPRRRCCPPAPDLAGARLEVAQRLAGTGTHAIIAVARRGPWPRARGRPASSNSRRLWGVGGCWCFMGVVAGMVLVRSGVHQTACRAGRRARELSPALVRELREGGERTARGADRATIRRPPTPSPSTWAGPEDAVVVTGDELAAADRPPPGSRDAGATRTWWLPGWRPSRSPGRGVAAGRRAGRRHGRRRRQRRRRDPPPTSASWHQRPRALRPPFPQRLPTWW